MDVYVINIWPKILGLVFVAENRLQRSDVKTGGGFRVAEKRVGQIADSWLELGACADDRRRQSTAVSGR